MEVETLSQVISDFNSPDQTVEPLRTVEAYRGYRVHTEVTVTLKKETKSRE